MITNVFVFLRERISFSMIIFLCFLFLFCSIHFYSAYLDVNFVNSNPSNRIFNATLLFQSSLKFFIAVYFLIIINKIIRKKITVQKVKFSLFVLLFSPIIVEVPFIILDFIVEANFFSLNNLLKKFIVNAIFFIIWFSIITFSKKMHRYLE